MASVDVATVPLARGARGRALSGAGRWFADRSVNAKILTAVGVVSAMAVGTGILGISELDRSANTSHAIAAQSVGAVVAAGDMESAFLTMRLDTRKAPLAADAAGVASAFAALNTDYAAFKAAIAKYTGAGGIEAAERALIGDLTSTVANYVQLQSTVMRPLAEKHDLAAWLSTNTARIDPVGARASADVAELVSGASAEAAAADTSARNAAAGARELMIVVLIVGMLVGVGLALLVAQSIVRATRKVGHALEGLADGDLTRTAGVASNDEIGRMAQHLDLATASMREAVGAVANSAHSLASSSEELSAVSTQLAAGAEETGAQVNSVSAATEQISRNVQTVASGAEEMGASIREISQNASEAAKVGGEAVEAASEANRTIAQLGESSVEIGNVIKLITSVAEQTNLLALNATIEAARAGDAGKGFAVVANEVKELAQQTAKATEDISRRVEAIQGDSSRAVEAIARISEVIDRINDYQMTIASAVEQQSVTTNEMSRNVVEASAGVEQVSENMSGVAGAVNSTTGSVTEASRAANDLARMSADLTNLVSRFRY